MISSELKVHNCDKTDSVTFSMVIYHITLFSTRGLPVTSEVCAFYSILVIKYNSCWNTNVYKIREFRVQGYQFGLLLQSHKLYNY